MTDIEKVIKGLEEISDYFFSVYHHSKDREEINKAKDRCDAVEDALALLKEQEPVRPKYIDGKRNHFIMCGNCNTDLMRGMKYCSYCGRAVKWDG